MKATKIWLIAAGLLTLAAFPARAADNVSLRLDWINSGYHAIWYYGRDKGVFRKHGIALDIREGHGSSVTAQTVGNNSVMFGTADGGAVMVLISKGLPVKIVASYLRTSPMAIIFPKKKNWKSWKDLAGSRIAFSAGGASAALFPALERANGLKGKIKLVFVDPPSKPTSLLAGKVDAIDSFGFLQEPILNSKGLPSTYFTYASGGVNVPGLALIASNKTIASKKDLVRRMVASFTESLTMSQKNPEAAIDSLMKAARNLNRATSLEILKGSFDLLQSANSKGKPAGWTPPMDIKHAQQNLENAKLIKKPLPIAAYFTNEFIGKAG